MLVWIRQQSKLLFRLCPKVCAPTSQEGAERQTCTRPFRVKESWENKWLARSSWIVYVSSQNPTTLSEPVKLEAMHIETWWHCVIDSREMNNQIRGPRSLIDFPLRNLSSPVCLLVHLHVRGEMFVALSLICVVSIRKEADFQVDPGYPPKALPLILSQGPKCLSLTAPHSLLF